MHHSLGATGCTQPVLLHATPTRVAYNPWHPNRASACPFLIRMPEAHLDRVLLGQPQSLPLLEDVLGMVRDVADDCRQKLLQGLRTPFVVHAHSLEGVLRECS